MSKPHAMKENSYQGLIDLRLYEACPKAVFAAIAASFIINHQARGELSAELLREWYTLHINGVVPQRPPGKLWGELVGGAMDG